MAVIIHIEGEINALVDTQQMQQDGQKLLELLQYADYDLGILLCSDQVMLKYNKEYRQKNKVTDVLSFAYHPLLKAGQRIVPETEDDKSLGDIIIAPDFVERMAQELGVSLHERMKVLLVHGICHLLGYDHIKDEDFEVMKKQEEQLLAHIE